MAPAPTPPPDNTKANNTITTSTSTSTIEQDLEKEVELIHRTAEKQLASVNGLNASLAKKILKSEAQTSALLECNKDLEAKNAHLVSELHKTHSELHKAHNELHKAQDNVRSLDIRVDGMEELEKKNLELMSANTKLELLVKKLEKDIENVTSERDRLDVELTTRSTQLDETELLKEQLREELDQIKKETADEREERSRIIILLTHEKDELIKWKQQAEIDHQQKDEQLAELDKLLKEEKQSLEEAQRNIQAAEARVDEMKYELDAISKQKEAVNKERDFVIDDRDALRKEVASLKEQISGMEAELSDVKAKNVELHELLNNTESSKKEAEDNLESKLAELALLTASLATLRKEHEDLSTDYEESQRSVEQSTADFQTKQKELDSRTIAWEGERNLLISEKAALEKDYTDARDRVTTLEREKSIVEKRVYDLEDCLKVREAKIVTLEQEKDALVEGHEQELSARLAEQQAAFELNTTYLRTELNDVVDRYAAKHRATVERGTTEGSGESDKLDDVTEKEEVDETKGGATTTSAVSQTTKGADLIEPKGTIGQVADDDVSGMEVPEAPIPFAGATKTDTGGGVQTDDVAGEGEGGATTQTVTDTQSPQDEGNTVVGIVSEEVMQEEVVDEADEDNVLEEVDEEQPVPEDEAAEKKKLALNGTVTGLTGKDDDQIEQVTPAVVPDVAQGQDVAQQTAMGVDEGVRNFNGAVDTQMPAETKAARGTSSTGSGEKQRRAGSRMLNSLICCVKVEEEGGHTSR